MSKYEFFPKRPPGPVDDAYVQVSWVRAYRPSGPRWLLVGTLAVVQVVVLFVAVVVLLEQERVRDVVLAAVVAGAASLALCLLILRLALTGIWVSDAAVRVVSLTAFGSWPWTEVADVRLDDADERRVVLVLADGRVVRTPARAHGLDFLGRREALTIAAESAQGWFEQSRRRRR